MTFLILGIVVILMNIGLIFIDEAIKNNRQAKRKKEKQNYFCKTWIYQLNNKNF